MTEFCLKRVDRGERVAYERMAYSVDRPGRFVICNNISFNLVEILDCTIAVVSVQGVLLCVYYSQSLPLSLSLRELVDAFQLTYGIYTYRGFVVHGALESSAG